jgi:plastocyanin
MSVQNLFRAALVLSLIALTGPIDSLAASPTPAVSRHYYLPSRAASKIVTATAHGEAAAEVVVLTQPVAIKETGPKETINTFGEVYTFSPTFIVVHRDEPTQITFWNLQTDDDHDFALLGSDFSILMYVDLPPLRKTSYILTFHKEGLFNFKCMQHQPAMNGQFLVLPPTF